MSPKRNKAKAAAYTHEEVLQICMEIYSDIGWDYLSPETQDIVMRILVANQFTTKGLKK